MKKLLFFATLLVAFVSLADAQIIGSTNSATSPRSPKVDNSPLYRPTGGYIRFSGGFPTLLSVAYNYQLTPSFMFGGGVGVGFVRQVYRYWEAGELVEQKIENSDELGSMPIYAEAELRTPKYKWSLFLNIKVGYSLFTPEDKEVWRYGNYTEQRHYSPWLIAVAAGASYKNLHLGVGMSNVSAGDGFNPNVFLAYSFPLSGIKRALF